VSEAKAKNMKSKFATTIEIVANVSIIALALIGGTVLIKNYLIHPGTIGVKQTPSDNSPVTQSASKAATDNAALPRGPAEGSEVSLPDINWSETNESVVLALSNQCHFCTESAPFYQRLTNELSQRKDVRLIAVFPQEMVKGKEYLDKLGVPIKDVRQATLNSIGVRGTPTLIIVDSNGKVRQAWIGRLSPEREAEVLNKIKA